MSAPILQGEQPKDGPIIEVAAKAQKLIAKGWKVLQKFTCGTCGNRLTMAEWNKFYRSGTCDHCGQETQIEKCGFMAVMGNVPLPDPKEE